MSMEGAASPPQWQGMIESRSKRMDERDLSAVFARAERAERQANQAIGMIAAQAERIRTLESRIETLEKCAIVRVEETTP